MTTNQLILLLDCHRGFNLDCHCGTLEADAAKLKHYGYIKHNMDCTELGDAVAERVLKFAGTLGISKEKQLERQRSLIDAMRSNHELAIRKEEDELRRIESEVQ